MQPDTREQADADRVAWRGDTPGARAPRDAEARP
jgi:hypothetical protein